MHTDDKFADGLLQFSIYTSRRDSTVRLWCHFRFQFMKHVFFVGAIEFQRKAIRQWSVRWFSISKFSILSINQEQLTFPSEKLLGDAPPATVISASERKFAEERPVCCKNAIITFSSWSFSCPQYDEMGQTTYKPLVWNRDADRGMISAVLMKLRPKHETRRC